MGLSRLEVQEAVDRALKEVELVTEVSAVSVLSSFKGSAGEEHPAYEVLSGISRIPVDPATESGKLSSIENKVSTESTLSNVKTKARDISGFTSNIPSDPATESGKLSSIESKVATETTLSDVLTKTSDISGFTSNIPSDPATESGKLSAIEAEVAKETTLSDVKTKAGDISSFTSNIPSDPAKESGKLSSIDKEITQEQPRKQTLGATISSAQVTVSAVQTLIRPSDSSRRSLVVQNLGPSALYIGASGITTDTGVEIAEDGDITLDRSYDDLYGISPAGINNDIRCLLEKD